MKPLLKLLLWILVLNSCQGFKTSSSKLSGREFERKIFEKYSRMQELSDHASVSNYDTIGIENDSLLKYILYSAGGNSELLFYNFDSIQTKTNNDFNIVTSDDGLVKVYSWDSWLGGTQHNYINVFQYKSNNKISTVSFGKPEGFPSGYCTRIFSFKTSNQLFYLAEINYRYSTKDRGLSIKAFQVKNGILTDSVKIFKQEGKLLNEIECDFNLFSLTESIPYPTIVFDSKKNQLLLPKTGGPFHDSVTNQKEVYQFSKGYFLKTN